MKVLKWTTAVICVISIIITVLFTAVDYWSVQNKEFYRQQYVENDVYDFIDIEEDELMRVTDVLLDYLSGKRDSLYVEAEYNGGVSDFFDEIEKAHMIDVQVLYVACIWLRRIAVVVLLAGIIAMFFMLPQYHRIFSSNQFYQCQAIREEQPLSFQPRIHHHMDNLCSVYLTVDDTFRLDSSTLANSKIDCWNSEIW